MRLRFSLNKIELDPVCHIQILRHASEFQNRHVSGQLYGALYDNKAQVTSVMAFPNAQKTNREQLQAMEKKQDDYLSKFNLDTQNLGWYFVCYNRNFWDQLEMNKYFEKYINTSFFLVFDFKARLHGGNPYRAFRLKDESALKDTFKWSDLQNCDFKNKNPFTQIPVQVRKNELFEVMMLFKRRKFIDELEGNRKKEANNSHKGIRNHIEDYIEAFEEYSELQKSLNSTYAKNLEEGEKLNEKPIEAEQYYEYLGQSLKLEQHEQFLNNYQESIETYQQVFDKN